MWIKGTADVNIYPSTHHQLAIDRYVVHKQIYKMVDGVLCNFATLLNTVSIKGTWIQYLPPVVDNGFIFHGFGVRIIHDQEFECDMFNKYVLR